jgi:hypothetical protein
MRSTQWGWIILPAAAAVLALASPAEAQIRVRPGTGRTGGISGSRPGFNGGMNNNNNRGNQPNNFIGNNNQGQTGNQPGNNLGNQPGNNLGDQPGGLTGNPPANNNLGGQPGNQPNNNFGQPGLGGNQPGNQFGNNRPPDFDPWANNQANQQMKDDMNKASRAASGGMIAVGIVSLLCGLAILGCVGWLVFQNGNHSAPPGGGRSKRRR